MAHPMISPDPARVRFVSFGAYSLDLELYAYVRTSDWAEFLQVREDVILRVLDVVEEVLGAHDVENVDSLEAARHWNSWGRSRAVLALEG